MDSFSRIRELASQSCEREACMLYDLEWAGSGASRTLRVYICKDDGRISVEDCEKVSRALNLFLDTEDLIPGGTYHLEVSSPGLERHLKSPWHFKGAVGESIKVKLKRAMEGSQGTLFRNFSGRLTSADEAHFEIEIGGQKLSFPIEEVDKARVVFEVMKQKKR